MLECLELCFFDGMIKDIPDMGDLGKYVTG